jgi:hypothetical protein
MTRKMRLAAIGAVLVLAACSDGYGGPPTPQGDEPESMTEEMMQPQPMLPEGEIDDATGTQMP